MKKTLSVLAAFGFVLGVSGMAMAAGTGAGTMTTSVLLTNSCTVSNASMTFASSAALLSTADQTANTVETLQVACSTGITAPTIWSETGRTLTGPGGSFAVKLSQTAGAAADDLPTTSLAAEAIAPYTTSDGAPHTVTLYGKILAADFGSKSTGTYTAPIVVSVNY